MRATFTIRFTGTQDEIDRAVEQAAELLTEAGYFFDEDFTTLHAEGFPLTGLELRTAGAVRAALDALPRVGACIIETNPDLLDA